MYAFIYFYLDNFTVNHLLSLTRHFNMYLYRTLVINTDDITRTGANMELIAEYLFLNALYFVALLLRFHIISA